jgi:DNA-binding IclR family transcriptional regulator
MGAKSRARWQNTPRVSLEAVSMLLQASRTTVAPGTVALRLGISRSQAGRLLNALVDAGRVRREGVGRYIGLRG